MNGLECNNKIIQFYGYKCTINNKIYCCDLTYYTKKEYVILCDENSRPQGIISYDDLIYLKEINKLEKYVITNITTIILTNYSILALNKDNKLIGIISIL
jgi:hypothetical protein